MNRSDNTIKIVGNEAEINPIQNNVGNKDGKSKDIKVKKKTRKKSVRIIDGNG
jgi:hypothetical protein